MTRKLIESTFVTLDGVIGDPQIWGPPYWDDEHAAYTAPTPPKRDVTAGGVDLESGRAEPGGQRSVSVVRR